LLRGSAAGLGPCWPSRTWVAPVSRALLAAALLLAWLLPVPGLSALEFDAAKLQQTMQSRYGARGVQALRDWLRMLQEQTGQSQERQLQAVNTFWNQAVLASEDPSVWGEADYWATPLESLGKRAGDCEDFVIGKYFSLLRLGIPVEKLRLVYVRARVGGIGSTQSIAHMVLGFYETPVSEPLVLDSLVGDIQPASQRTDLTPVFSFNAQGVYVAGASRSAPVERISRWRGLLARMQQEGFMP
jgi:predicted transglutaminase-like cysteine proteinase